MIKIHSIETFWTHEWPGIRIVVFLQWCMMRCLYCHNPDTIDITWGKEISNDEIIQRVSQVKPYFWDKGWITFSGWECLLQSKELIPLCKELKILWYHIVIDTNGYILNNDVKELLIYTDLVLLDIKHLYEKDHIKLTGVSNKTILKFAHYLESIQKHFRIRQVFIPWWSDDEKHWEDVGKYFKDFQFLERIEILPYHTLWVHKWKEMWLDYKLDWVLAPTHEELLKAKNILEKNITNVFIRK
jgi:pyruvate formate lyase activating enzyme